MVDPACRFLKLDARLTALGFVRDATEPFTADTIPGEPELAAWTRGDQPLTYTFNPKDDQRDLDGSMLISRKYGVSAYGPVFRRR